MTPRARLVAILGPTATGKSAFGIALATRFGGEVVSCDSTAVYRGFDIGTDKVPLADRRGVPLPQGVADAVDEVFLLLRCEYAANTTPPPSNRTSRSK